MTPSGIVPATCRFVAQSLNHYATARPSNYMYHVYFTFKASIFSSPCVCVCVCVCVLRLILGINRSQRFSRILAAVVKKSIALLSIGHRKIFLYYTFGRSQFLHYFEVGCTCQLSVNETFRDHRDTAHTSRWRVRPSISLKFSALSTRGVSKYNLRDMQQN